MELDGRRWNRSIYYAPIASFPPGTFNAVLGWLQFRLVPMLFMPNVSDIWPGCVEERADSVFDWWCGPTWGMTAAGRAFIGRACIAQRDSHSLSSRNPSSSSTDRRFRLCFSTDNTALIEERPWSVNCDKKPPHPRKPPSHASMFISNTANRSVHPRLIDGLNHSSARALQYLATVCFSPAGQGI